MRVVDRSRMEGELERITVVPETVDDLWHLKYILEPGDTVRGDTTRRIQREDETFRDTGGEREHLYVGIIVDDVEFHRFANRLRVSGQIEECSREDQLGHHHTLNVEIHDEIEIEKQFQPDQLERLHESESTSEQPEVAIITVEEARAHIHTVAQYGTEEYATIHGPTGKGEYARDRAELFGELADAVRHLDVDAYILAGPGFTKQDAYDRLVEEIQNIEDSITVVDTSAAGDRGVHEVLTRGALEDVQMETRIAREAALIDELKTAIASDDPATYGIEAVAEAAEFGAVDRLLVLDERLRRERAGEGDWEVDIDELVSRVDQQGGEIIVFSSEFEPARELAHLGGIAALLRYPID